MEINPELIVYAVTVILSILSVIFGEKYRKYKQKFMDTSKLAEEFSEALLATTNAIEDDKLTPEEAQKIVAEWQDVVDEAKKLLGK